MVFNPTLLSSSTLQQVRWLLGGARVDDLLTDEEINFALTLNNSNIYLAGAECADKVASHFSATSQRVVIGPFQSSDWQLRSAWDQLARHLRNLGMKHSSIAADQIVPGMTVADIEAMDEDEVFADYSFKKAMHDNPDTDHVLDDKNWSW